LRVAGTRTGKNRWVRAFYKAGHTTAHNLGRVMHVLWLEVAGLLFLLLALVGAGAAIREYRHGTGSGSGKMLLAALFAVIFAYFGASSFWRAQRKK
jgi:drug/metabolite transporter (DMT)-like permease